MDTITQKFPFPQRRAHRAVAFALVVALIWLLAACSSSTDESSTSDAGAPRMEDSFGGADAMAPDADGGGFVGGDMAEEATQNSAASPGSQAERDLIITGSMYITVEDPVHAAEQAATTVRQAGGRIDARNETAPREEYGGAAWLTLRVPNDKLDDVVADLRELGTVDEYSTTSYDVTTQVTDLETQISTLRASTKRVQALLVEAEDIGDIIALETELANRQAQLESLEAHQRGLDDQVSMSSLELSLTTEPVIITDDDPTSFWDGLQAGWDNLVAFFAAALTLLGVALPWIALAAIITLAALAIFRGRRRKARAAVLPASTVPPSQQTNEGDATPTDSARADAPQS